MKTLIAITEDLSAIAVAALTGTVSRAVHPFARVVPKAGVLFALLVRSTVLLRVAVARKRLTGAVDTGLPFIARNPRTGVGVGDALEKAVGVVSRIANADGAAARIVTGAVP